MDNTSHWRQIHQTIRDKMVDGGLVCNIATSHNNVGSRAIEFINLLFCLSSKLSTARK